MEFNMTEVQATTVVSSYEGTMPVGMSSLNPLAHFQIQSPDKPMQSPTRPLQTHALVNHFTQQTVQQHTPAAAVTQPRLSPVLPQPVKTLVFFDLETTGLPSKFQPVSITEIAMVAVDRAHFEKQDKAEFRVINKLTLCLKPQAVMHPMAAKKSGLDTTLLKDQGLFHQAQPAIRAFLSVLAPPICLLAHNGDSFDFPIFMDELVFSTGSGDVDSVLGVPGLACCDTLKAVRHLWPVLPSAPKKGRGSVAASKQNSYALDQLYKRFCGRRSNAHHAEQDCVDLMKVCHTEKAAFVAYVDANAAHLADARRSW
ncbi:three prime repair exonuclease 2-like isoform X1 [Dermacentor andersoni]|uniref:three prime repair exonuclease 2-like isoform X1 n=2 Tax=Dermacentor andersoni TaxID=34620 RepID=UPI002155954B|nr:three-prime repair exonuclease 1-like isoform X1 [Dermacentor andersoni]